MNTSERLVWGEPGMWKMAGRERAFLMTRDQGAEGLGVGKGATGGCLWGRTEQRALAHSKCSVNGETSVRGEEKETNIIPWIHIPIHVFIWEVFSKHLMHVRNCSRNWGHSRETDGCFHEASISVRRDGRYIGCQTVTRLMQKSAAESGLGTAWVSEKRGLKIFLISKILLEYSCFILLCLFFFLHQRSASVT